ncbi:ER membrane protein complex subunit 4 [Schizosaccharomyces cryophilus OY26]|uniref:ER membrane protein complex subunit 4 n=1 Tax=Schizosaccharomyces cryophilus (strain OY26 / ATCC MYA-4695 / CBS 11777 / NBRC 106824 / NRRL Y48691) TaxID=653667 RepID=S9XE95_SCHCR|nr:ER membrane protein complex subunit 4 [Schizosaccharomyces cryophilus OY26]EPY52101.1 ER membrane protein complex subunit 4 [Schizosaccharomyces cryophilus OY26]
MPINDETDWYPVLQSAILKTSKGCVDTSEKYPSPRGFQVNSNSLRKSNRDQTSSESSAIDVRKQNAEKALIMKKAWELAYSPLKQIPMNLVFAYMSGNSLQIFSIITTFMLFLNPLKAISAAGDAFSSFRTIHPNAMWPPMIAYILAQCLLMAIGIYKLQKMGLLPTTTSDWLAWENPKQFLGRSFHPSK